MSSLIPIQKNNPNMVLEIATFAGGCFWCTEAVFQVLEGVESVVSGYLGGQTVRPTYKEICTGTTGHAEAVQITFDTNKVSFADLLSIFFATHDPTTLNRQGNDVGTQYRSEVFYHNDSQKVIAEDCINLLALSKKFSQPIVTKISASTVFYPAEAYHQNYYNQNKTQGYCSFVIAPKMEKLQQYFSSNLKK
jgi:peptide-methionine (S)-S-oxide reductase